MNHLILILSKLILKPYKYINIRGAIQKYVDFCCRIVILQPITPCFSQNKVLSKFDKFLLKKSLKCIACQKLLVTIATHKQDRGAPYNFKEILVAFT